MAHEYSAEGRTFPAASDLSAKQFCFMKIDSNGRITTASDGGADAIGVLTDKPAALGRAGRVISRGTVMVKSAATIAAGDAISCDSNGAAVAYGTGDKQLGTCVTGGASGEILSVLLDMRNATAPV